MDLSEKALNGLIKRVKAKLQLHGADNITTWLGEVSNADLKKLRQHFREVKREPWGFIYFKI